MVCDRSRGEKMRRVLLMMLIALLILSGCGGKAPGSTLSDETENSLKEQTELPEEESTSAAAPSSKEESTEEPAETTEKTTEESTSEPTLESSSETETSEEPAEEKVEIIHLLNYTTHIHDSDENYEWSSDLYREDLGLSYDFMQAYPELTEVLEKLKLDSLSEAEAVRDQLINSAGSQGNKAESTHTRTLTVARSDSNLLSWCYQEDTYCAGARKPYRTVKAYTLDAGTGKEIRLSEIVNDMGALRTLLKEKMDSLLEEFGDDADEARDQAEEFFEYEELSEIPWTVGYDRLTFYFDEDVVLPPAFPAFTLTILFSEKEDLFSGEVLNVPDAYIIELPEYEKSVLSDGRKIFVTANEEKTAAEIFLGDAYVIQETEFGLYDVKGMYVMHDQKAGDYLYLCLNGLNDLDYTWVFDLKGEAPVYKEMTYEGMGTVMDRNDDYSPGHSVIEQTITIPVDPSRFEMDQWRDFLSTNYISRSYKLGENGTPEPLSDWYELNTPRILTLRQDVELNILEQGTGTREKGRSVISAGESLTIFKVQYKEVRSMTGQAWTDDGAVAEIQVDFDEEKRQLSVNGIDIYDLFDGMAYSG